jgi:ssDNA-binding replication factor A large subunit
MVDQEALRKAIEKIAKDEKISIEDAQKRFDEMVQDEIKKFSGLMSESGAKSLVIKGLGVKQEIPLAKPETRKIRDITPELYNITVVGRIVDIGEIREVTTKRGDTKVVNITIADETGSIPSALWGANAVLVESGKINVNDIIKIKKCKSQEENFKTKYDVNISIMKVSEIDINPPDVDGSKFPKKETILGNAEELSTIDAYKDATFVGRLTKLFGEPKETKFGSYYIGGILSDETGDITFNIYEKEKEKLEAYDLKEGEIYEMTDMSVRDPWMDGTYANLVKRDESTIVAMKVEDESKYPEKPSITGGTAKRKTLERVESGDFVKIIGTVYDLTTDYITKNFYRKICPHKDCKKGISIESDEQTEIMKCRKHGQVDKFDVDAYVGGRISDGTSEIGFRAYGNPATMMLGIQLEDITKGGYDQSLESFVRNVKGVIEGNIYCLTGRVSENPNDGKLGMMVSTCDKINIEEEEPKEAQKILDVLKVQGK